MAADCYYSIAPPHKEANDYEILKSLGCHQYWVLTRDDDEPGETTDWEVIEVIEEAPIP